MPTEGSMKYLSVCAGIEAASVAWHPLGWHPLAFSEIEAFPRAVLAYHYPGVPLHGDFTKLRDDPWIVDADVLVGGTPCQAFSVAGLRRSLDDDRGNLSLEFVRLADAIDDFRLDAGKQPAIVVWENVPGVLSVKDNAFGCFLSALAGEDTAINPPGGKWTDAGVVDGPRRRIAWRILDAQYFGLAQRRRRVFVVASAREGFDPAAVLFELEGVRRDTPPRRETGQAASARATGRAGERSHWDGVNNPVPLPQVVGTLDTECGGGKLTHQSLANGHVIGTITARMFNALGARDVEEGAVLPCYLDPLNQSANTEIAKTLAARDDMDGMGVVTCASEDGTGLGTPLVPITFGGQMSTPQTDFDMVQTLQAKNPMAVAYAFAQNSRDEVRLQGGNGQIVGALSAEPGMKQTTYVAIDAAPCVAVAGAICKDSFSGGPGGRPEGAAAGHFIPTAVAFGGDVARTLSARQGSPCADRGMDVVASAMAVRRLTPVECERLQGFPDAYTMIPWRNKPAADCPDGPRYKALGNSMAVPCMRWIGNRIALHLKEVQ